MQSLNANNRVIQQSRKQPDMSAMLKKQIWAAFGVKPPKPLRKKK